MKDLIEIAHNLRNSPLTAYWDYQNDGTHFCSECGCDAPYNKDGKEICSTWCPTCGCFMTEVRNDE